MPLLPLDATLHLHERVLHWIFFVALALPSRPAAEPTAAADEENERRQLFAETFDQHWQEMRDAYPYFDLYGVDWDAEREEHRDAAINAPDPTHFAWELARLFTCLPDPHLAFVPPPETMRTWSVPDVEIRSVERRPLVLRWPEGEVPPRPAGIAHDVPEIVAVRGAPAVPIAQILAAGPPGTSLELRLRWSDATETTWTVQRPETANVTPPSTHYGKGWLHVGRVGSVGYLRIRTFDPSRATLGADGKITTMLRAALRELADTEALILDLQQNGGGLVAASDPFLGHFLKKAARYRWGNSGGKQRVVRPRKPLYDGAVVAIVDAGSASGGEWAARILRDAQRATVLGGRTAGAEAAVHTSSAPDGSMVHYSAWPFEPRRSSERRPFQEVGIALDHELPLTVAEVRRLGYDAALDEVRAARYALALKLCGGPPSDLDALLSLAAEAETKAE